MCSFRETEEVPGVMIVKDGAWGEAWTQECTRVLNIGRIGQLKGSKPVYQATKEAGNLNKNEVDQNVVF